MPAATSRWKAASSSEVPAASRPGSCARSRPGSSAHASRGRAEDEWVEATRAGLRSAASRGVVAIHDKDGWLGAPGIFQRVAALDGLTLRVWQSVPYERLPELEALGVHCADRRRLPPDRLPEGVHGRDARLPDRVDARRLRRRHHERRGARGDHPRGRGGRLARRRARDRRPRRTARRSTRSRRRATCGRRSGCASASSTRSASRRRTLAALPSSASRARCSSATPHRIAISLSGSGRISSTARTRFARSGTRVPSSSNGSDAPVEELDPLAGIRAGVTRTIDDRPAWHPEQSVTVEEALRAMTVNPAWLSGDERRRGKLLPGYLADLVVLSRDPLDCPPDELESVEVVATMVGGRWVHNPPPWDYVRIDRSEGRQLFGSDPAGYDRGRPGHAEQVYEVLVERCGLGPGTAVLESRAGHGAGDATAARARRRSARRARAESGARRLPPRACRRRTRGSRGFARGGVAAARDVRLSLPQRRRSTGSTRRLGSAGSSELSVPAAGSRSGGRCSVRAPSRTPS